MRTGIFRFTLTLTASLLGLVALGCSAPTLEGMVIPGRAMFVAAVERDDPRWEEVGIPNARVRVTLVSNGLELADTTTDSQGRFKVKTRGELMARGTVRVVATADGFTRVDDTTPLRSFDKVLIVAMRPAPSSSGRDGGQAAPADGSPQSDEVPDDAPDDAPEAGGGS